MCAVDVPRESYPNPAPLLLLPPRPPDLLELCPQFPDALSSRSCVFGEDFLSLGDALVKVKVGDLLVEEALDVLGGEGAGGGVGGGNDVELEGWVS